MPRINLQEPIISMSGKTNYENEEVYFLKLTEDKKLIFEKEKNEVAIPKKTSSKLGPAPKPTQAPVYNKDKAFIDFKIGLKTKFSEEGINIQRSSFNVLSNSMQSEDDFQAILDNNGDQMVINYHDETIQIINYHAEGGISTNSIYKVNLEKLQKIGRNLRGFK